MYLIPLATNSDNTYEMWPIRETRLSLGVKGFCWWLVTKSHSDFATQLLMPQTTQKESKRPTYHMVCTNIQTGQSGSRLQTGKTLLSDHPRAQFPGAPKGPVRTIGTFGECARFETQEIPFSGGIKVDLIATYNNS